MKPRYSTTSTAAAQYVPRKVSDSSLEGESDTRAEIESNHWFLLKHPRANTPILAATHIRMHT